MSRDPPSKAQRRTECSSYDRCRSAVGLIWMFPAIFPLYALAVGRLSVRPNPHNGQVLEGQEGMRDRFNGHRSVPAPTPVEVHSPRIRPPQAHVSIAGNHL